MKSAIGEMLTYCGACIVSAVFGLMFGEWAVPKKPRDLPWGGSPRHGSQY